MRRSLPLVFCTLVCIAVVAVQLGGMEAGAAEVLKILINFFMFVIPMAAAVLLVLYGSVIILARLFHFSARKPLALVCTAFPLPVGIASAILVYMGLITTRLAIGCTVLSIPVMMYFWLYRR